MKRERLIRRSQIWTWVLAVLAGFCLALLLIGQFVVLSTGGREWTLVGRLEGQPLAELDDQTLLAGSVQKQVSDVRVSAAGCPGDMVRLYIDEHLTAALTAGGSVHLALEAGQRLSADGEQLTDMLALSLTVEGRSLPEAVQIMPGTWQDLVWEL